MVGPFFGLITSSGTSNCCLTPMIPKHTMMIRKKPTNNFLTFLASTKVFPIGSIIDNHVVRQSEYENFFR